MFPSVVWVTAKSISSASIIAEREFVYGRPGSQSRPGKLFDTVRTALRTAHSSRRTERAYARWIRRYILFQGKRHPAEMGQAEVSRFLSSLAVDGKVAASPQNQALAALLFLYGRVLGKQMPWLDNLVRARRPRHLPVVRSRAEVRAVLDHLTAVTKLMACLLSGGGLRLLECARLRVKDVDFEAHQIIVRGRKGGRDPRLSNTQRCHAV